MHACGNHPTLSGGLELNHDLLWDTANQKNMTCFWNA